MYGILTKEQIFERVSQQDIFSTFLNMEVKAGILYLSPFRKDSNPTCGFHVKNGKLYLQDFSGDFHGDCFDAVQRFYGVNYSQALEMVYQRMIMKKNLDKIPLHKSTGDFKSKEYTKMEIMIRDWNGKDFEYWSRFGIDHKILQFFQVYAIQYGFTDGKICYRYDSSNPCYAYRFGENDYKLYFPFANTPFPKFLTNSKSIQGLKQLPEKGKILVITKSMKDVMVLRRLGIFSVAFQSEVILPPKDVIDSFKEKFENVYSFYDFDLAGIRTANKMRKLYGIKPIFLSNGKMSTYDYKAKDPADYVDFHGINNAINLRNLWMRS
jgi:hypothetical protein